MTASNTGPDLTLPCAISGDMETLTVRTVGRFSVSFVYGPDASVVVVGADLLRMRAILDAQIANWRMERP